MHMRNYTNNHEREGRLQPYFQLKKKIYFKFTICYFLQDHLILRKRILNEIK